MLTLYDALKMGSGHLMKCYVQLPLYVSECSHRLGYDYRFLLRTVLNCHIMPLMYSDKQAHVMLISRGNNVVLDLSRPRRYGAVLSLRRSNLQTGQLQKAQAVSRWPAFSLRKPTLDPRPSYMRFVVDKVKIEPIFQFSPVSIMPPMLITHFHLHVVLTRRTN